MLTIQAPQVKVFEDAAMRRFEEEMVAHSQEFAPRLSKVLGGEQLHVAVREAIARANGYGFTYRGPIRLVIELGFLFGSGFDTDPQYPWAAKILGARDEQMQRAERLHAKTLEYQERVSGPEAVNTRRALEELLAWARGPVAYSQSEFTGRMRQEMARIFPQKAAYVGDGGILKLIQAGSAVAQQYRFPTVRGQALVVALMFAFGHRCIDDPLYPWISGTLGDERIVDAAGRADRLEKKSITWLEHVLGGTRAEG